MSAALSEDSPQKGKGAPRERARSGYNHFFPARKISNRSQLVKRYLRHAQWLRKQGYHKAYGRQMIATRILIRRWELRRMRHE
jgi:hypothetical protein